MFNFIFSQASFWKDFLSSAVEIAVLWYILYKFYLIIRKTNILSSLLLIYFFLLFYAFAYFLDLSFLIWLFHFVLPIFIVFLLIIFQQDLRVAFLSYFQKSYFNRQANPPDFSVIQSVLSTMKKLSENKWGGLIVLTRHMDISGYIQQGHRLDAQVSSALMVSIFSYNSPLHDGALVIKNDTITWAACQLPLSDSPNQFQNSNLGTRHRSALGIAEQTDAIVFIVSEQNSAMSVAYANHLYYDLSLAQIKSLFFKILKLKNNDTPTKGLDINVKTYF